MFIFEENIQQISDGSSVFRRNIYIPTELTKILMLRICGQGKPSDATTNRSSDKKCILIGKYNTNLFRKHKISNLYFLNKKNQTFWCLIEMVFEKFRKNPEISVFSSLGRVILFFDKKFEFYDKIDS